ncbi:MAG: serine/threonine-protein kinase [Acidobacteriota bacterium]
MAVRDDDQRQREIDALFDAALDVAAADRADFLDRRAPHPEVRAAVERLLGHVSAEIDADGVADTVTHDLATGGALAGALGDSIGRALALDPATPGERIGPYRVIDEIARGGMAVVYRAERADGQFEQTVALKLALTGTHDATGIERFHQERQILASLRHPSIAQLLDGGLTDDGRPWFAMELVEGARIDRWCDVRRLDVRARLRLFVEVARAVEVAHRSLVVHRDIKPSNVLVDDAGDGAGRVKLLDFGIAKLLDPDGASGARPALTRAGTAAMTPELASPEQLRGELVTTASDVYQLGLLLYELLTGRAAHKITRRTPVELFAAVLERIPDPPSVALGRTPDPESGDTATGDEIAALRNTTPTMLRRELIGDLDTIVLRALDKDVARRYGSVAELADDVERHLAGRPVSARADSVAYRVGKFVRRHRLGVAAVAATVTLIVALVVFYTLRLDAQRDAARAEAARAELARADAEAVAAFLVDLFEEADPSSSGAEDVSARDLLARGSERLTTELLDQPLVQARLLSTISRTQERIGLPSAAEEPARRALALRLDHLPAEHPEVAQAHFRLAVVLKEQGRLNEAEGHYREAVAIQEATGDSRRLALTLASFGDVQRRRGETERSEAMLNRSVELLESTVGADHIDLSYPLLSLGLLLQDLGRFDEAEVAYSRSLEVETAVLGDGHIDTTHSLNNLANLEFLRARHDEALALHQQILTIREAVLGPDHPDVAGSLINVAGNLTPLGRPEEATEALQRARAILIAELGPEHPRLATIEILLGDLADGRGDPALAADHYQRALDIRRRALGPDHVDVAAALGNLAGVLDDLGRFDEAEASHRRSMEIFDGIGTDGHVYGGIVRINLADLYRKTDRREAAVPMLRRAVEILERTWGVEHPITQTALADLATVLDALDRGDEAATVRARIVEEAA